MIGLSLHLAVCRPLNAVQSHNIYNAPRLLCTHEYSSYLAGNAAFRYNVVKHDSRLLMIDLELVPSRAEMSPHRLILQQAVLNNCICMSFQLVNVPIDGHEPAAQEVCLRAR